LPQGRYSIATGLIWYNNALIYMQKFTDTQHSLEFPYIMHVSDWP